MKLKCPTDRVLLVRQPNQCPSQDIPTTVYHRLVNEREPYSSGLGDEFDTEGRGSRPLRIGGKSEGKTPPELELQPSGNSPFLAVRRINTRTAIGSSDR